MRTQYVALYLERDLSQLINVKDMREFEKFLALCAGRTGQLLNLSELARDAGISHTTARGWLSILEQASAISAIEIKSNATFRPEMANTLLRWATIAAPNKLSFHPRHPLKSCSTYLKI